MEPSNERKLAVVPPAAGDAAWDLLDAVWDVPVGLGLCDRQLRFIRVNAALAGFDGLSVEAHYEEDSLARLPAEFAQGLRQAALGEPDDVEFISSGRCVLVKLHPVLRPTDRAAIGIGVVAIDVTDKRDAFRAVEEANHLVSDLLGDATAKEQALSRLIGSLQEGLLVLDPTGRMKLVNRAAERILGHPREALVGAQFEDERWWCADGSGNRDAAALLRHAVEHPDLFHGELYVETDAGRAALSADATSLRDIRGDIEEVVVSLRDVTRERHELELARSNLEFQQQIVGIVGSVGLLRRQKGLTRESVESLDRVARSAARMARLISDLLDYARTRAPEGLPVVLARADLHLICKDALEECRAAHPSTRIVLETVGDATGCWDADRIEQALINLITNAIQYGGSSTVGIQSNASAAHIVEIKVHNGGAVIPADVLPELFKAYRRGIRGESTARRTGLGLGLFIVAQIAAAHGGSAFAKSSAESGTTFTIQLPRSVFRKGP